MTNDKTISLIDYKKDLEIKEKVNRILEIAESGLNKNTAKEILFMGQDKDLIRYMVESKFNDIELESDIQAAEAYMIYNEAASIAGVTHGNLSICK